MTHALQMLETTPSDFAFEATAFAECIDACFDCAQSCSACADACLGEAVVQELVRCIRLDLDCADVCEATGRVLSRQTHYDAALSRAQLEACALARRSCGEECEAHAEMHGHCRVCAEACRRCESACRALLTAEVSRPAPAGPRAGAAPAATPRPGPAGAAAGASAAGR